MNRQERRSRGKLIDIRKLHPVWVRAVAGLAAVVMFCTVYALILPAAAITGAEATEEIGFYREETGEPDTATAASAEGMELVAAGENDSAEESSETAESANMIQESQTQEETSGQAAQTSETDDQTPETEEQAPKAENQPLITEDQTHIAEGQTTKAEGQTSEAADQTTKSTEETTEQTSEPTSDETSEQSSDLASEQSVDQSAEQESSEEETSEDEEAEAVFKEGELTYQGGDYTVSLAYEKEAKIPEKAFLKVKELTEGEDYENCLKEAAETVEKKEQELRARLFDITICIKNKNGVEEEIQPADAVRVNITYDEAVQLPEDAELQVVHLADEKSEEEHSVLNVETEGEGTEVESVTFDTEHFSVFVVMYTVDFEYSVNGKMYQFSLPGGGFVSFTDLVEVLGIIGDTNFEENGDENGSVIADNSEENAANEAIEENGINSDTNTALTLGNVEVSEATRKFVSDVAFVEFSSPELVDVSKVENETTVGEIKEIRGLDCEYSAELTEKQIAEINAQTVEAGDWALISLKAFDTEESLTITMKNGEKVVIKVTDAQIQKDYITASGETYTIMVTYDNDAEIPDGADLKVREIEAGTKEFDNYLSSAASELEAQKVIFARFFDIVIADQEGNKVEPKAPVQVQICYKDPIGVSESEVLSVVHFTESSAVTAPEVITDITLSDDETEVTYEQSSFSVTGTVVQSPTADHTYALVIHHTDGNYYVVENDGSLTQIKTEDLVFNGDGSVRSVKMINPICWTYQDIGYSNYNIWHDSDANDYDYGFTHLPTSYERRYLTTDVPEGFVDLDDDVNPWTLDGHYVNLQYNNDTHVINHYDHVFGVKQDTDGTLRICGQASEAAEIFFAEAQSVSSVSIQNHTVSHIDISVEGYSGIKVPLAYGTYKLAKVSEEDLANIDSIGDINSHIIGYRASDLVVAHGSDVTLEAEQRVPITQNDIKKANIYAYTEYTGERVYLDDVYAVTGYSGNADTGGSITKAQVRLEGSFKVADMQPVTYANTEQEANDWNYWENGQNTGKSIKEVRLERKIYYTVEVEKSVTFTMTYTDPSDGQVYIVMREDGNPFRVTVDTTLSNSFHYWDDDNTCPGIDIYGRDKWKQGALYSNIGSWQYIQSGGLDVGPGFDFELGAPIDEANHDIVAIEVTKYVQGDFGDEVRTLSLREGTSCGINVYQNNSLTPLHDKTLSVGKDGIGMINDYDVTAGTYDNPAYAQISEDPDTVADTIIDAEGNKWVYDHSRVETEFAYRNNGQNNPSRYVSDDYTKENELYYSQSEVIGEYTVQGGQPYDYNDKHYDGVHEYNRFLEFYVYNIYKPVATDITIKKVDDNNQPLSDAVFELYKHNGSNFEKVTHSTYSWLDENDQFKVPATGYTLTGLTDGTYQIKEIKPPDGYVITEDTPITFTVENGTVVEASNDLKNGATYTPAQDAVEDDPVTMDTDESKEATNDTFTIPNTPGAALPNTGGPGTKLFSILGGMLILIAGALLIQRRRLI